MSDRERVEALAKACWLIDGGDPEWGWDSLTDDQRDFHREQAGTLLRSPAMSDLLADRESHRLDLLRAVASFVDTNGGDLPLGLLDSIRAEIGGPR